MTFGFFKKKPAPKPVTPVKAQEPVVEVVKEVPVAPVEPAEIVNGLQESGLFYDEVRISKLFGPVFSTSEFQGVEEILKDCKKAKWPVSWVAYALATAYHETAHTMQPIKEYGGRAYLMNAYDVSGKNPDRARKMGNTTVGDGAKYCGRGYVQLTWKVNYKRAGDELGVDLVNNPDKAMDPDIASDIMILGMSQGWFTGKSLSTYLPRGKAGITEFTQARRIINGTDHAAMIGDTALKFQKALIAGKWL